MNADVQRVLLLSTLGYTGYIVATCPCEQMALCKRDQFLVLATIPLAFAIYNYIGEGKCGK